jgi:hypothetical protein
MEYNPCPNCGHDMTAHSAWIANPGNMTCEEISDETYLTFFDEEGNEWVYIDEGDPDGPMFFQA